MQLAVLKGSKDEDNVIISCVPYTIGRCRTADFIITHVNVSRNHCEIVKKNGLWKIYDLSSSGTYVNDTLIGRGKSTSLNNGDRIRFGRFESDLCRTFYSFDTASENVEKHCSNKAGKTPNRLKQNGVLEGNEETPKHFGSRLSNVSQNTHHKNVKVRTSSKKIEESTKELQVGKTLDDLEEKKQALQKESNVEETTSKTVPPANENLLEKMADLMEAEFQCTICSELFVTAVTLGCTHTFCKYCIDQWKRKQKTCPVCRKKITNETRSLVVDNYIDKMVGNLSVELKERREAIIKERNETGPSKKRCKLKK